MSVSAKLAGFLLALVVVFLVARGVGAVTGPVGPSPGHDDGGHAVHDD